MQLRDNDRLRPWPFFLLMASVFAVYVGYGIALPVLPFLLERLIEPGARFSVAWHTGMIAGLYMLALFVFAPLWGWVSDRIGRRPVILLGSGGCVIAIALFGNAGNLWLAYAARGLGGILVSAVLPVTLAYIGDTSARELRARRFAWMSAASALGFLAGPALGALLLDIPAGRYSPPFLAAAAGGAFVWLAVWFGLPDAEPQAGAATRLRTGRKRATSSLNAILLLALVGLFGLGSFEVATSLQGARVLGFNPARIGLLFMVCSVSMLFVQLLIFSPLLRRLGFGRLVVLAFAAMILGLLSLPFATGFPNILLLVTLIAAGSGVLLPMLAYRTSLDAGDNRGMALGRQTAAASLGQGLGSAAAGWLFTFHPGAPFWVTAGVLGLGLLAARRVGTDDV